MIPAWWTQIDVGTLPNVKNGNIVLALTSSEASASGFVNNLNIIEDTLQSLTSSTDYATKNYALSTKAFSNFTKLWQKSIVFGDKEAGIIYEYEAKYNANTPLQKFVQSAKVCKNKVYLITVGVTDSTSDLSVYEPYITNFVCK